MQRKSLQRFMLPVIVVLLLSCVVPSFSQEPEATANNLTSEGALAVTASPSPTRTLAPLPSPTLTPSPTWTPSPTPWSFPVSVGTPYPTPQTSLASTQVGRLKLLAQFGKGSAEDMVYSAALNRIAVASSEGVVWYDADTLKEVAFWPTSKPAFALALSPDERTLAVGAADQVLLWDIAEAKISRVLDMPNPEVERSSSAPKHEDAPPERPNRRWITSIDFSPNGAWIAATAWARLAVWETSTGELYHAEGLQSLRPAWVYDVRFTPDSRHVMVSNSQSLAAYQVEPWKRSSPYYFILAASTSTSVTFWNGDITRYNVGNGIVTHVAASADGRFFAVGFSTGAVAVWDKEHPFRPDPSILPPWKFWWPYKENITALEFTSEHTLSVVSGRHLITYDVAGEGNNEALSDETLPFTPLIVTRVGEETWAAVDSGGRLVQFDVQGSEIVSSQPAFSFMVEDAVLMPQGNQVVLAGWSPDLVVRDLTNGNVTRLLHIEGARLPFTSVGVPPDGSWVAAVDWDGAIWHCDLETGKAEKCIRCPRVMTLPGRFPFRPRAV